MRGTGPQCGQIPRNPDRSANALGFPNRRTENKDCGGDDNGKLEARICQRSSEPMRGRERTPDINMPRLAGGEGTCQGEQNHRHRDACDDEYKHLDSMRTRREHARRQSAMPVAVAESRRIRRQPVRDISSQLLSAQQERKKQQNHGECQTNRLDRGDPDVGGRYAEGRRRVEFGRSEPHRFAFSGGHRDHESVIGNRGKSAQVDDTVDPGRRAVDRDIVQQHRSLGSSDRAAGEPDFRYALGVVHLLVSPVQRRRRQLPVRHGGGGCVRHQAAVPQRDDTGEQQFAGASAGLSRPLLRKRETEWVGGAYCRRTDIFVGSNDPIDADCAVEVVAGADNGGGAVEQSDGSCGTEQHPGCCSPPGHVPVSGMPDEVKDRGQRDICRQHHCGVHKLPSGISDTDVHPRASRHCYSHRGCPHPGQM